MAWSFLNSHVPLKTKRSVRAKLRPAIDQLEERSVPSATLLTAPSPQGFNDWMDTDGSNPVTVSVLDNDKPAPNLLGGAAFKLVPGSVAIAVQAKHGKAVVDKPAGTITYTANAGFTGSDTYRYTFRDSSGAVSRPVLVTIQINRPVAGDDWTDTDAGNPVSLDVLENDSDPDGNDHIHQPGSVAIVKPASHGSVVVDPSSNEVTYTPAAGFGGTDSFQYTVTDDAGATSTPATVFVRVNRPNAADDFATFNGTTPVVLDVLENDTDPDGVSHISQPGTVTVISPPAHGSASLDTATNEVTYTAAAGFAGTDSFQYTITDDAGATSVPATVTMVGANPTGINDDVIDTDGRVPVVIDVLANDGIVAKGSGLAIATQPKHGTVRVNHTTGAITYTAKASFGGTDSFVYKVKTDAGTFSTGTVSVIVNVPVANDDWTDTDAGNPVALDVLENDSDPDGADHIHQAGSVKITTKPAHGKVTVDPTTNIVTYTPSAGYGGTDSFKYTVSDDAGATSAPAKVLVRVNRPTANADEVETHGTAPVIIDVLENDTDPDGKDKIEQAGSVQIPSQPLHGTATLDAATNKITYTANAGFVGTDTFRYFVTDEAGAASLPATVTILVDGPVAANAKFLVSAPDATIFLLGAASDASHQGGAKITIVASPKFGTLSVNRQTGQVTYTPSPTAGRMDSFKYTITDAVGAVSLAGEIDLINPIRFG
ncbi:MAG TPA: Ig-like domain-containing protein [Gemmataceae bacterium]|jgi:hypothetical protein|nr:Ig-like domain-containing protein [Gemmataceae bacterium]